jgi:EAL and modified HD-GYP domain-containing signal transduction protein
MIMSDAIELLPKKQIVLEVLETVELNGRVLTRIDQLRKKGFTMALDDVVGNPKGGEEVFRHFDILKIDVKQISVQSLTQLLGELRGRSPKLLAEKVDNCSQAERCLELGFDYLQGYFFSRPEIIAGKRLSASETVIMQSLNLLASDADLGQIELLLKKDATLTFNLLRLTNSVGLGTRRKIGSISEALVWLGRRQLQRWLQLLLFASGTQGRTSPLMHTAATRGRLLELLAGRWGDRSLRDRAFMTGTLSLMDALLGIPLPDIIKSIRIADDVREALFDRTGRLGLLLQVAESVETGDLTALTRVLSRLRPLDVFDVDRAHADALTWANSLAA